MNDETIGEDMDVAMSEHKDAGVSTVEAQKHLAGALLEMRRNVAHLKGVVDVLKSRCNEFDESMECLESRRGDEHLPTDSAAQKAIADFVKSGAVKTAKEAVVLMKEMLWVRNEAQQDIGRLGINATYAEHQQIGAFRLAAVLLKTCRPMIDTDVTKAGLQIRSDSFETDDGYWAGEFLGASSKMPLDKFLREVLNDDAAFICDGHAAHGAAVRKQMEAIKGMIDKALSDVNWPVASE